jgi:tetratricopeptide (TPR) repeat protein
VAEYRRQKALGLMSTDESSLDLLGFRFFSQRQPKTAIAIWELEVHEFPRSWHAYDNLGLGYKAIGDTERSIANYRRALAINPSDDTAKRALAGR